MPTSALLDRRDPARLRRSRSPRASPRVKALVTGADGFVGRWLVEHLEASGDEVWRGTRRSSRWRPAAAGRRPHRPASVDGLVEWAEPEAIYHLAAVAFGPDATSDIGHAVDVTVRGTAFLLDAAARLATPPLVLIPSSSEVYGRVGPDPVRESHPLEPVSPYGATKVAQESIALAFMRSRGVPVAVARAFNHIGPGQRPSFVVPSFAAQLAHIARDADDPVIRVGNLERRTRLHRRPGRRACLPPPRRRRSRR